MLIIFNFFVSGKFDLLLGTLMILLIHLELMITEFVIYFYKKIFTEI